MHWRDGLAWLTWPLVMASSVAMAVWGFARGYEAGLWLFVISVVNFMLVVLLEHLLPRRRDVSLLKDRQSLNDIGHGVLVAGAARPLAGAVTVAFLAWWTEAGLAFENPAWPVAWSLPLQIVLVLLITSFLGYWRHRVHHTWGFLWSYHALHHSPQQLHVLKGNRLHFGEELLRFVLIPLPLLVLGAPAEAILWMTLWSNFSGGLAHSNVDQRFPNWFHAVVPTVHVHSIHHAQDMEHQTSNLSPTICLWDHLFGTFLHPKSHPVERLGIEGDPVPAGFFSQLAQPFVDNYRSLRGAP